MVRQGVNARRLSPRSFGVLWGLEAASPVVYIMNIDGLVAQRRSRRAAAIWLPAALLTQIGGGVRRTDRLRFLLSYHRRLPAELRPPTWKRLWRKIDAVTGA
jgi:hypothetical protein